ncbi:unnamed protein product [Porites evermanni]|uniref:Receptor ligand binding region domain-containing protein n=1 Tax=Porites evermanni TaxID=104178 RepID=A0ABN8LYI6_9CNID|nr:unnamed protein product [Porites evermanni]
MSCNQGLRAYKDGDVMLGGLISLHMSGEFSAKEFGLADAVIFAIDMVNKNSSLLANVSLGYDIRNYCDSRVLGMQEAFDFKPKAMTDFIERFNWTYVAVIGLDNSYGRNGILALERE